MEKEFMTYEAPKVEVVEVQVEKGFAVSQQDIPMGDNPFAEQVG